MRSTGHAREATSRLTSRPCPACATPEEQDCRDPATPTDAATDENGVRHSDVACYGWPHLCGGKGDGGVIRVLLTGMSGTGKSTVIADLAARGYKAVDADEDGLSETVSVPEDEPNGLDPGQDWVWREDRIQDLLSPEDPDPHFLGGCAPTQGKVYPWFDHVVLLTAPAPVIVERLTTRTTNPYGQRPEDIARTLALLPIIEPMLRRGAGHEIDTIVPLDQVVARVLQLVGVGA